MIASNRHALLLFAATFTTTLAACASSTSGSPPASANALGPGYALAEGDEIVANPEVRLARTYWTIVRASDGSDHLLPRPEGAPALARACESGDALAARLRDHALCETAESAEAVAKINALDAELAMQVSTLLHRDLRFRRTADAIEPSPLGRDLLEVCRSDASLRDGAMKARCADEEKYADGRARPAIFRAWTEAELEALPPALNALYGVEAR